MMTKPERIERHRLFTDALAVAVVVSLPWSTSVTNILISVWFVSLLLLLPSEDVRGVMRRPAAFLPVALFLIMALGMLWAIDVPWIERGKALRDASKLLAIPLLMFQFSKSGRGHWVLSGFLASCIVLLVFSFGSFLWPDFALWSFAKTPGLPVKDHIMQGGLFALCAFILLYLFRIALQRKQIAQSVVYAVLAAAFLINIFFVITGRTALVTLPVLLVLYAFAGFRWKAALTIIFSGLVLGGAMGLMSDYTQERLGSLEHEIEVYQTSKKRSSAGERLEFWKKSIQFVLASPVIGHGTGSIRSQFKNVASEGADVSALVTRNPHNQFLAVTVQVGLVGGLILIAMWGAHFLLFFRSGLVAWVGLAIVAQNVVGSLFNSHLFDFGQGWLYAFGVGIVGGLMMRAQRRD